MVPVPPQEGIIVACFCKPEDQWFYKTFLTDPEASAPFPWAPLVRSDASPAGLPRPWLQSRPLRECRPASRGAGQIAGAAVVLSWGGEGVTLKCFMFLGAVYLHMCVLYVHMYVKIQMCVLSMCTCVCCLCAHVCIGTNVCTVYVHMCMCCICAHVCMLSMYTYVCCLYAHVCALTLQPQ